MLSMPLAYPSTLDRRGSACPPAYVVLRGGVLEPVSSPFRVKFAGQSRRLFAERISARNAEESFSLRRGLDSIQCFSSWASPLDLAASATKRRPVWVALDWLVMRLAGLARMPPSEGKDIVGPALRFEAMPARQDRRGRGCVGQEDLVVGLDQHRSERRIDQMSDIGKTSTRNIYGHGR